MFLLVTLATKLNLNKNILVLNPMVILAIGLHAGLINFQSLLANPSGENIVQGNVTFAREGSTLTINQATDRAIINWQDFSIAFGETTTFQQPSSSSATLNRVVTGNPSSLLGNLSANGQVFLINPNGVVVGAGARIETGSFIASTLDVNDSAFMEGDDLLYSGDSKAKIVNHGVIHSASGDIVLISREIENYGTLRAIKGTVALGAGSEVLLAKSGEQRIFVKAGEGSILNKGLIQGVHAELHANGGNHYALAINNEGVIRATGFLREGGRILLTSKSGTIANSGRIETSMSGKIRVESGPQGTVLNSGEIIAPAGEVFLLGERIGIIGEASIDVSGPTGGRVFVGGGYQGKNPTLQNAKAVFMAADTLIRADAAQSGNGGRVILWSDEFTGFYGKISARGGSDGGDGGFIETSSQNILEAYGTVDASAPAGVIGHWLLDPRDVTISFCLLYTSPSPRD